MMTRLIIGVKGTGKTKQLIKLANDALETSKGSVVCLEKGAKLIHEIKYQARLMNTDEYDVQDAGELYGFIAGMYASNHDITDIFVDSALKICNNDLDAFISFVSRVSAFADKAGISVVMTSSIPVESVPDALKPYLH